MDEFETKWIMSTMQLIYDLDKYHISVTFCNFRDHFEKLIMWGTRLIDNTLQFQGPTWIF